MTILVAMLCDTGVWVGGDGRISDGQLRVSDSYVKWRSTKKGFWWGAAGYARIFALADRNRRLLDEAVDLVDVGECLRKLVIDDGWEPEEKSGGPRDLEFNLIVVSSTEIVAYDGDGSFVRFRTTGDFFAAGSGADYAFGAVSALRRYAEYSMAEDDDCDEIIESALTAACDYDLGCGGELFIEKVVA